MNHTVWQSDGRVWVWQMPGEHYLPDCIVPNVKFGGGGKTVWGCFLGFGRGHHVNASACQHILDNAILPTVGQQFGEGQHDCAPANKARTMMTSFDECGVEELE